MFFLEQALSTVYVITNVIQGFEVSDLAFRIYHAVVRVTWRELKPENYCKL